MKMESLLQFLGYLPRFKETKRSGWKHAGLSLVERESVPDHSLGTALLAYMFAGRLSVNREKLVIMAILHNLPEVITEDITPHDDAYRNKRALEASATKKLCELLDDTDMQALLDEIQSCTSPEAQSLHQLDKLEMAIQALWYEKGYRIDLSEFWNDADQHIKNDFLRSVLAALRQQRPTNA